VSAAIGYRDGGNEEVEIDGTEFSEGSKNVGECDEMLGDKILLWGGLSGMFLVWIGDTVASWLCCDSCCWAAAAAS
jgi:hypothetical protein